ncbi:MAG: hypothetical protein A3K19_13320 [Lentisphaerae bacterium RIFOXYB12_FULL_65_16]|nr:MAG: hypothetical protein A3K18_01195 [Lentisphaerae bacterium RIFOXYA12_64_32]OGV90269.1 MAG: hypothetical protein A3K19_13320 [Lentisphaerae bacterium RIFOXYB12_FULL_65_16]
MDAKTKDGWLYVLSCGRLCTFRTPIGPESTPAGQLDGLGNTRQIEIAGNLAAITSREDGLRLVDVSNPERLSLLSHYDTIELATGIALGANVALVACRVYGVELIDISNPKRPRHLSTVQTGEAQSVVLHNGFAYVGVWVSREVVVCDVRNPGRPAIVNRIALDGYGDGVTIRGNICFAATGHHARTLQRGDPGDPGYGAGHGLEIFDVSDPTCSRPISRIKLPRLFGSSWDMWDVAVSGDLAVVGDTHNGIYVFDISDLVHPVPVGHHRLPVQGKFPDAVGGFAVGHDCIYVAGIHTGLHTVSAPGLRPVPAPPEQRLALSTPRPRGNPEAAVAVAYRPEGQVHEVAFDAQTGDVWVAAGKAGLHRLSFGATGAGRQESTTDGVAFSVDARDGMVVSGEGRAGMSIWRRTADGIALLGRYQSRAGGIGQVRISPDQRYVIAHAGTNTLEILDITSPQAPRRVLEDRHTGLFYRTPFGHRFLPGTRFACLWHVVGVFVFDLDAENGPEFSGWAVTAEWTTSGCMHQGDGVAVLGDRLLVTYRGGYAVLNDGQAEVRECDVVRLPGHVLAGKPTIFGTTLYVAHRLDGAVTAVDIADPQHPVLRWSLQLDGNPGPVVETNGTAIIPAGYDGVLVRRRV